MDYPAPLLDGTTDIALSIKVGAGTGYYRIDSIELQDTENDLTDLPGGTAVVNSLADLSSDNRLTSPEKTYLKTVMTEIDRTYGDEDGDPVQGFYYAGVEAGVITTLLTEHGAHVALHTYIDPLLVNMVETSDIDSSIFDGLFSDYYTAKNAVVQSTNRLNAIIFKLSASTSAISVSSSD